MTRFPSKSTGSKTSILTPKSRNSVASSTLPPIHPSGSWSTALSDEPRPLTPESHFNVTSGVLDNARRSSPTFSMFTTDSTQIPPPMRLTIPPSPTSLHSDRSQASPSLSCVFQQTGNGTMELRTKHAGIDGGTPLYRITVHPNCFNPTSYITTITYLVGHEQTIGSFEMGVSRGQSILQYGDVYYPLDSVFENFRKKVDVLPGVGGRWTWNRPGCPVSFEWDCRYPAGEAVCRESTTKKEFARMTFPKPLEAPSREPMTHTLQIYDRARRPTRDISHDILISALIVERKRLTPSEGKDNHRLFN